MTNLQRWLMYAGIFLIPYLTIISGSVQSNLLNKWMLEIQLLPIVLVGLFGVYAVVTVLHRTLNFNDCPEAAAELKAQIVQARKELTARGFTFRD